MTTKAPSVVSADVLIVNKRGLHARASAKLVAAVSTMPDSIVTVLKDGHEAAGENILDLMMLGAAKGDYVTLRVDGPESAAHLAELVALVETGFGED